MLVDAQTAQARVPLLATRGLTKNFGAAAALREVSLDVYENDVLGIVGDNGAGKSTFLSLLAGYYQPDGGHLEYRGKRVTISSPAEARRELRMELVYQDLALAPDLSVWENMFCGAELKQWGVFLARRKMKRRARETLERLRSDVDPGALTTELSGGQRQTVAVARALLFDRDIVMMDEPTAAVSVNRAQDVLSLITDLKDHGKTVLLISHRLDDVLAVCNRVAVFVAGSLAELVPNVELQVPDLIHMMFGSPLADNGRL